MINNQSSNSEDQINEAYNDMGIRGTQMIVFFFFLSNYISRLILLFEHSKIQENLKGWLETVFSTT